MSDVQPKAARPSPRDSSVVGTWVFDTSPAVLSLPGRGRLVGTSLELNPTDDTGAQVDPPPWVAGDVITISTLVLHVAADPVKVDTYWQTTLGANVISLGPQLRLDVAHLTADSGPDDIAWPVVEDVAARLRQPLTSFTPLEQQQLREFLDSAADQARRAPAWRTANLIPPRVWSAVVSLAALDYWQANPATTIDSPVEGGGNPSSARYRYLVQIGLGRGAKPVAR